MLEQFSAQEVAKPTFKAPTLRRNGQTFANDMIFTLRQKNQNVSNRCYFNYFPVAGNRRVNV